MVVVCLRLYSQRKTSTMTLFTVLLIFRAFSSSATRFVISSTAWMEQPLP
jgi:hypothetical protein